MKIEWQYYQFIVDSNPTVSRWALHELRIWFAIIAYLTKQLWNTYAQI
jgi:hypothetical protein